MCNTGENIQKQCYTQRTRAKTTKPEMRGLQGRASALNEGMAIGRQCEAPHLQLWLRNHVSWGPFQKQSCTRGTGKLIHEEC